MNAQKKKKSWESQGQTAGNFAPAQRNLGRKVHQLLKIFSRLHRIHPDCLPEQVFLTDARARISFSIWTLLGLLSIADFFRIEDTKTRAGAGRCFRYRRTSTECKQIRNGGSPAPPYDDGILQGRANVAQMLRATPDYFQPIPVDNHSTDGQGARVQTRDCRHH